MATFIFFSFIVVCIVALWNRNNNKKSKSENQTEDEQWVVDRLMAQLKKDGKSNSEIIDELKKRGYNIELKFTSLTDEDISYSVDVENVSCNCPDFLNRRFRYQRFDPRRLCKHLIKTLMGLGQLPLELQPYIKKLEVCNKENIGYSLRRYR